MKIETILKRLLDENSDTTYISDVPQGVLYNLDFLTAEVLNRFEWSGLPETIPSLMIEKFLILCGALIPVKDGKGNIWVQPLNAYGVGVYPEEPPKNIYANPVLGSGNFDIEWYKKTDCVCFENGSRYCKFNIIMRTAKKLARTESTIDIILTNNNGTELTLAKSQNVADAITKIFQNRKDGKIVVPVTEEIIDIIGDSVKLIQSQKNPSIPNVTELLTLYNNQLRQFYRSFGILITKDKTQAVLSDETDNDTIYTNHILEDGLAERKKWCEMMNSKYSLNIDVKISKYLLSEKQEEPDTDAEEKEEQPEPDVDNEEKEEV